MHERVLAEDALASSLDGNQAIVADRGWERAEDVDGRGDHHLRRGWVDRNVAQTVLLLFLRITEGEVHPSDAAKWGNEPPHHQIVVGCDCAGDPTARANAVFAHAETFPG